MKRYREKARKKNISHRGTESTDSILELRKLRAHRGSVAKNKEKEGERTLACGTPL